MNGGTRCNPQLPWHAAKFVAVCAVSAAATPVVVVWHTLTRRGGVR